MPVPLSDSSHLADRLRLRPGPGPGPTPRLMLPSLGLPGTARSASGSSGFRRTPARPRRGSPRAAGRPAGRTPGRPRSRPARRGPTAWRRSTRRPRSRSTWPAGRRLEIRWSSTSADDDAAGDQQQGQDQQQPDPAPGLPLRPGGSRLGARPWPRQADRRPVTLPFWPTVTERVTVGGRIVAAATGCRRSVGRLAGCSSSERAELIQRAETGGRRCRTSVVAPPVRRPAGPAGAAGAPGRRRRRRCRAPWSAR